MIASKHLAVQYWHPIYLYIGLLIASGCITLSFTPFNLWPLSIVALIIYQQVLNVSSFRETLARSLFFGVSVYLFGAHWVYVSMYEHGGVSSTLAVIMTIGFCVILSVGLMIPAAILYYFCRDHLFGRTLGFAACWFLHEWSATWVGTGFPWLFLGYAHLDTVLMGWVPIIGAMGVSFIIALTAALCVNIKKNVRSTGFQILVLVTASIWLVGPILNKLEWVTKKSGQPIKVALVQPNYTLEQKWDPDNIIPTRLYYRDLVTSLEDQTIIIWPETAITEFYQHIPEYLSQLDQLASSKDSAIILGIPTLWHKSDRITFHNSIIAIGDGSGMYHKQRLVPFGEYVPFEDQFRGLIYFFDLPLSDFSKGKNEQPLLNARGITVAPYICYEIVYPNFVAESAKHADLLLTVSNDTWFGRSIGPKQHLQMAQMRALENGRYLLRDTNDGITAVINPRGQIIEQLEPFTQGILKAEVYAMKGLTPLAHYGTLPVLIVSILILLILVQIRRKTSSN